MTSTKTPPAVSEAPAPAPVPAKRRVNVADLISKNAVLGALIIAVVVFSLTVSTFPTIGNIRSMLSTEAIILILALGVTLTLRLGDFDLSFGANMNMSAVLIAVLTVNHHYGVFIACVIGVALGLAIGLVNALLVVRLGLNSFVATLGMMTVLEGIASGISHSNTVIGVPVSLTNFVTDKWLGLPSSIWFSWIALVLFWVLYEFTVFGRNLLFVGGNRRAARLAGVRADRVRYIAYIASGGIFGLAGVLLVGQIGAGDPTVGAEYLLPPLAGAFLGSTTIQPGRFNALGTIVGVYLLMVVSSGLQLLGAASWVSDLFNGVALIAAIVVARLSKSQSTSVGPS